MIGESVLSGFKAGAGSRRHSGVADFIRGKLAEAKQNGLLQFQGDVQTQGALNIAKYKGDIEGGGTFRAFQADPSGGTVPVTYGDGQTDFPKGAKIFSASEGLTEGEKAAKSAKGFLKAGLYQQESGGGSPLQQGINRTTAAGSATPVSSAITTQQRDTSTVSSGPDRQIAIDFLQSNGAPVTEANIQAVIQQGL